MLQQEFLGNTLYSWGISIIIVIISFLIMKFVAIFNKKIVYKLTRKTQTKLDDIIYDAFEVPILFAIILIGLWIAIHRLINAELFLKAVDSAYRILVVVNITWFFSRLVTGLIENYWGGEGSDRDDIAHKRMVPIVRRTFLVLVWIVGIITALSNVGVNISALLGTIGIGGVALALAAQDTVKNIFGAFTILIDKPFKIGDTVKIDSFEGVIVDVGLRSTRILNYDKRIVTFPNYKVSDALITNISTEPGRRVVTKLGLTYDTTPQKMNEAISLLREIPSKIDFVSAYNLTANFTDFSDFALVITFVYFIEKDANIAETTSNVNLSILESFNNSGLLFAFPTQTLYLEKL